jgi:hypothetical protein
MGGMGGTSERTTSLTDLEFIEQIKIIRSDKEHGLTRMREFLKLPGHLDRLFDLAGKGASKPKKESRKAARMQLPDGFPDQALVDVAKSHWAMAKRRDLMTDAQAQVDAFRDHHLGAGTLAADWPATWRTWMRNALKFNKQPWGQRTPEEQPVTAEVWRWRTKTFRDGDQEHNLPPGYWRTAWGPKPGESGCRAPN